MSGGGTSGLTLSLHLYLPPGCKHGPMWSNDARIGERSTGADETLEKERDVMQKKSLPLSLCAMAFLDTVLSLYSAGATGQEARKALSKPQPVHPELARQLKLAGAVRIEVVVGTDGKIKDTKVIGGHPILVEAALKAVRDWKYEKASSETKVELESKFQP